jgi:hypothetical protein
VEQLFHLLRNYHSWIKCGTGKLNRTGITCQMGTRAVGFWQRMPRSLICQSDRSPRDSPRSVYDLMNEAWNDYKSVNALLTSLMAALNPKYFAIKEFL